MKRERSPEVAEATVGNGANKAARVSSSPEEEPKKPVSRRAAAIKSGAECPYLDTISRQATSHIQKLMRPAYSAKSKGVS